MRVPGWLFPRARALWFGLTLPISAAKLILAHRTLLAWSMLPVALTLAIYSYVILALQGAAQAALQSYFVSMGWSPEGWTAWGLMILAKILLLIVGAMTFSIVAGVISSPFNDFLAEKTERFTSLPAVRNPPALLSRAQLRLITIDLLKTAAATVATIFALLISWVPLLNLIAFAMMFLLVCFQYVSYPQTRRGLGLWDGARFLWKHSYACVGFGAAITFCFALPLVSVLALPIAVVGGTLLVARAQVPTAHLK